MARAITAGTPVAVPGVCLQELLSGVRTTEQYERLVRLMAPFPTLLARRADHLAAARIANGCRAASVAAGPIDVLIAALAIEHRARLLTIDDDFARLAEVVDLTLEPL
jgi:predicted nucleic acid-binding protein